MISESDCLFIESRGCVGDLDADGIVTVADVLLLLGNFGNPCP